MIMTFILYMNNFIILDIDNIVLVHIFIININMSERYNIITYLSFVSQRIFKLKVIFCGILVNKFT